MELKIHIPGAPYRVVIQPGLLDRLDRQLTPFAPSRIAIITNHTVWRHWGAKVTRSLRQWDPLVISIEDGEQFKRLRTVESIAERLVRGGADRGAMLVAVGGGVVGDIAGFVAATYLRGVAYVQVPTTLLAMVDSSVGGKTGVNLRAGKNLVGSFHHPRLVVVDTNVLRTLPDRELHAGLFEVIKCGIIRSPSLFDFLERRRAAILSRKPAALARVIHESLAIKARVVEKDEKEGGLRRILNFGHTAGHALEAEGGYRYFLHGEAVAWGMRVATRLAEDRSLLDAQHAGRIHSLIQAYGPLPKLPAVSAARLTKRMLADKKTRQGVLHFVLPTRIGQVRIVPGIPAQDAAQALASLKK